jgi:ribose transport system permease protein
MTVAAEAPARTLLKRIVSAAGPLLALIAVYLLFAGLEYAMLRQSGSNRAAVFLTAENLQKIVINSSRYGICALGMTVVIIAGGIDLSVGSGVALCATALACGLKMNWNPALMILITLCLGGILGAINGTLVTVLRVVPFIVTLGTMTVYLGAAKMLAEKIDGGQTVRPAAYAPNDPNFANNQVPVWLQRFTSVRDNALLPPRFSTSTESQPRASWDEALDWIRFPSSIWLGALIALLLAGALHFTVFGRHVFALGSNEATARLCGVNVPWTRIAVYTLAGLFVALAGIYQFSRLSSGNPTSGIGLELRVIAAVVIGGGSLSGGRGSVMGTLAGAALMAVIDSGCTQLGVSNSLQDIILGVIIVAAVALDQFRQRRFASA